MLSITKKFGQPIKIGSSFVFVDRTESPNVVAVKVDDRSMVAKYERFISISPDIKISVTRRSGNECRIHIDADRNIRVDRLDPKRD